MIDDNCKLRGCTQTKINQRKCRIFVFRDQKTTRRYDFMNKYVRIACAIVEGDKCKPGCHLLVIHSEIKKKERKTQI